MTPMAERLALESKQEERDGRCKVGEDKVQEVGRQLEHQGGRRSPLP